MNEEEPTNVNGVKLYQSISIDTVLINVIDFWILTFWIHINSESQFSHTHIQIYSPNIYDLDIHICYFHYTKYHLSWRYLHTYIHLYVILQYVYDVWAYKLMDGRTDREIDSHSNNSFLDTCKFKWENVFDEFPSCYSRWN